jgi:hypothetical protein
MPMLRRPHVQEMFALRAVPVESETPPFLQAFFRVLCKQVEFTNQESGDFHQSPRADFDILNSAIPRVLELVVLFPAGRFRLERGSSYCTFCLRA